MRQTVRLVALAIAVSAVLATGILSFLYLKYGKSEPSTPQPAEEGTYTVGIWEGKLAVFEPSTDYPMKLYDVAVASLPPEEQQKLRAGITVQSDGELQALLEDYTS